MLRSLRHLLHRRWVLALKVLAAFGVGCTFTLMVLTHNGRLMCPDQQSLPVPAQKSRAGRHTHFLVVLVMSDPYGYDARRAVRDTWLRSCAQNRTVQCYFVIGHGGLSEEAQHQLEHEQLAHHDLLLIADHIDSYSNLTLKVLKTLSWAHQKGMAQYVLKCDDDTFVRLPRVIEELKKIEGTPLATSLYWGFFDGRATVQKRGKWHESQWVLCDRYLPYALGGGYVLGSRLLQYIARNRMDLQLFYNEDVSVGTWLAPMKDVRRVHDPRFDTEYRSRGCHNSYLVTHKKSPAEMAAMWEQIKWGAPDLCPGGKEVRHRLSYIYNWTVTPSLCCERMDPAVP